MAETINTRVGILPPSLSGLISCGLLHKLFMASRYRTESHLQHSEASHSSAGFSLVRNGEWNKLILLACETNWRL